MLHSNPLLPLGRVLLILFAITSSGNSEEQARPTNVAQRSDFHNSRISFERDQAGHVAFIGGSITEMNGYRPMVMDYLTQRFPETEFTFTDAGISSTCSTAGAFRLRNDVLVHGKVDLLFIEFAVNDDQDAAHSLEQARRGMEGLIRHTLQHSPTAEIVVTYFVNPEMLEKLQRGETPVSIQAHESVAQHYGATTIHLAQEVADRIDEKKLTWKDYGGVHPAPFGNAIPTSMIAKTLESAWANELPANAKQTPKKLPELLDPQSYTSGDYVPREDLKLGPGWNIQAPDWKTIEGSVRSRHQNRDLITCTVPGSGLSFSFTGSAVGVECVAGPDAGTLEYKIDSGDWQELNLSHRYSKGLHYPRTVLFDDQLKNVKHTISVRLSSKESDYGLKPAVRILNFVAN
ncbi:SGNH/GDSL hydrolase family protein [Thalassoglobus polymorphus]|uniref:SGNH hydrolase-type esterase domain-containing protein n=1 Tax=Thalassoglobus polymorphus TaxID=2527994 RepID=A0A517QN71_9PLAN|nr:SGNH/GDSL hydrolase family protein [Thalassoglobus polymorphus]QDT33086.1 hypothetical protein Mal48_23380 [Thalassoglobus polymorphus]